MRKPEKQVCALRDTDADHRPAAQRGYDGAEVLDMFGQRIGAHEGVGVARTSRINRDDAELLA